MQVTPLFSSRGLKATHPKSCPGSKAPATLSAPASCAIDSGNTPTVTTAAPAEEVHKIKAHYSAPQVTANAGKLEQSTAMVSSSLRPAWLFVLA